MQTTMIDVKFDEEFKSELRIVLPNKKKNRKSQIPEEIDGKFALKKFKKQLIQDLVQFFK